MDSTSGIKIGSVMTILVIRKPTNLEQHGEVVRRQVKTGKLDDSHFELLRSSHDEHYRCLEKVRETLSKLSMPTVEIKRGDMRPAGNFEAIVSVGGDGTLLSASHSIESDTPVIGIRSSDSSVGYLCAGDISQVESIMNSYLAGSLTFNSRARVKAKILKAEDRSAIVTFPVLNDFLYTSANPAATTRYRVYFGGKSEEQKSSGIWVATATGSTAAISAAGGEKKDPLNPDFQFVIRELYQSGIGVSSIAQGDFDGDKKFLELENHCANGILALDGERGVIRLKYGDRVKFLRGSNITIASPHPQ